MTLEYRDPKAVVDEISAVWRLFFLTDTPTFVAQIAMRQLADQEALNTVGMSWRPWRRGRAWEGGPIFEAHTLAAFTQYKEWAEGWFEAHPWPPDAPAEPAEHVDPQALVEGLCAASRRVDPTYSGGGTVAIAAIRHLAAQEGLLGQEGVTRELEKMREYTEWAERWFDAHPSTQSRELEGDER
jgi:hypothetical protein